MKNEPAFKVGEQVYYVDLEDDKFVIITGIIFEVNIYPDGTITYSLT